MTRKKVSIVGAGQTGAETALMLAMKGLGDIILLDVPERESQVKGKALDLLQATALFGSDVAITGTSNFADTKDSDLVIITAGAARKPGMSRDDLLEINTNIVSNAVERIAAYSPDTILIILSNPVDVMTYVSLKKSGFPKNRVVGQAGILDSARYRTFISQTLNVSINDVTAYVLGVHGDEMVPLLDYTFVKGIPVEKLLPRDKIDRIIERTRNGGSEIVSLLGSGSAFYAPAASLVQMAESILQDQRSLLTATAYLEGEYGYHDLVLGVPLVLGAGGIEKIVEIALTPEAKEALDRAAQSVKARLH